MKVDVKQVYTSVACNRIPEIVDWNGEGLICFGASNAVVIYDTKQKGGDPLTVLCHHRSLVNSVKWLRKPDGSSIELVSCSADKTAAIWTLDDGIWKVTSTLTGHKDGVTCVHGIYTDDDGNNVLVYTGSIDSTVKVFERKNGTAVLKQTINLNSGLCLTLHAHLLPTVYKPILLCALDDHKIHLFVGDEEYHRIHTFVGHEDWVRGLDVLNIDDATVLLASASQDTYIRLWRLQLRVDQPTSGIKVEEQVIPVYGQRWAVQLDAVLAGHEGWVYGVQWHPCRCDPVSTKKQPVYRLLSSSLDKTLIIWEPEGEGGGAWVERVRVGEVGGNGLGFYGSRFGPNGDSFVGHGYNGSFHIWSLDKETDQWKPTVVCGGHFNSVEDVGWEPGRGRYLMSVSTDQTTRVHAPWRRDGVTSWHELARPQVHGYDMSSLALVSPATFASAAEEKIVRVFRTPHNFAHNFTNIVGEEFGVADRAGPEGASVPSLGLSNKAVFGGEGDTNGAVDDDGYFVPVNLTEPPTEETLMQNTLWPEVQKLYGHGYEVFALAGSADGALLASACKASTVEHAKVLIWDTTTWENTQQLASHQLTVTQLAFSPDSQRLLSVSRDRRWTLFQRVQGSEFCVEAATDKTNGVHSRIIWCCAWAHDGAVFATGSREGKICVWSKSSTASQTSLGSYGLLTKPLELDASVTALAFAPDVPDGRRTLAAGCDSGVVRLYGLQGGVWSLLHELDHNAAHHLTVKRLTFRPKQDGSEDLLLGSCGSDHLVRVHSVRVKWQ